MATQQSLNTVQSLYVAYYGRPADPAGLQYWAEQLEASNGNLGDIINAFGNSPEYTSNLGSQATADQVNSLYQQLFGRDAEAEGLDFYTNMLNSGEKTLAEIALTISEAAQGSDRTTFEGRTAIANAFTRELDTQAEIDAYSTARGVGIGRDYLQRVNAQTSAEDVLNDAAPVVDTLLPETEPETPPSSGDGGGTPTERTFTATLDENDMVVFGGNATGPITLVADADTNLWTFTRNGIEDTLNGDEVDGITQGTATLSGDAQLFDNLTVTGTGQLTLNDFTSGLHLDGLDETLTVKAIVAVNQDISNDTYSNIDSYTVNSNATLTLTAGQADSRTITGESVQVANISLFDVDPDKGGSVIVLLDGAAAYDLSKITAGAASSANAQDAGTFTALVNATTMLDTDTDLGTVSKITLTENGVNLTLTAEQADGVEVTGPEMTIFTPVQLGNDVTVTALAADTDLSEFAEALNVTANVDTTIDISNNANLDPVDTFAVANGATFTLSARQADEKAVTTAGTGAVVVSGPLDFIVEGDNAIDLTSLPAFTFANGSLVVPAGVTVTLTAAQADGKVITGAGNVIVDPLGDARVDLSSITVTGSKTAKVSDENDNAVTLNSETKLGGFTLEVQDDNTLTMTAAQADSLVGLTGDGSAIINGTAAGETLNYSNKNGWTIDTLTINSLGGNDILYAPANVDYVTLNGGLQSDNYEVEARGVNDIPVLLGDFNMLVDVLFIGEGGAAAIDLDDTDVTKLMTDGVVDFTAVEDDDRLANNGTLHIGGIGNNDSVAGSRGADVFYIEEEGATLTNYAEQDAIDLSGLSEFDASKMEVRESDAGGQIAVEFDGQSEGLILETDGPDITITFTGANFLEGYGDGNDTIKVNIAGDIDESTATEDVNLIGGDADQTLTGGSGDDFLHGGAGANKLYGGAGDDTLYATADNTVYDGGEGDDTLLVFQSLDISGVTVTSVETLDINSNLNSDPITVTLSEAQLAGFVDENGDSNIEKSKDDRIELDADAGENNSEIMLAGSDGILHAINNLHGNDTINFAGLKGDTLFTAASDPSGNIVGYETGSVNDIENADPSVSVDAEGEWQFDTTTKELTYFDGDGAQTIILTGVDSVSVAGLTSLFIDSVTQAP